MSIVLGIDLGTQSVKALFYDYEQRAVVANSSAPLDVSYLADGSAEQNAEDWTNALIKALSSVDASIKMGVKAIGVSGQQHGFVALSAQNQVLRPVKLWCDTSTASQTQELIDALGGHHECIRKTGNLMMTGFTAPKILHLKQTQPELYRQLDCILLPHDYLNFWLSGEKCMEMGDASGTGLLDINKREWSSDALAAIDSDRDLSDCLPVLRADNQEIGRLTSTASQQTGLPIGTPVSIGGGDNMMGAIGTGNVSNGSTTVSLGTSGTVYAYHDAPVVDEQGSIAGFCSSNNGWLPLLCTMNCTVTTELYRQLLGCDLAAFDVAVNSAPLGSEGLLTLPFFNGERSPALPFGSGGILGISSENFSQANFFRSGIEGATLALRSGIDSLESFGVTVSGITLTGGGSKSPLWRQMVADVMQKSVTVMNIDEGAAYGAALQAYSLIEHDGDCSESTLAEHINKNSALGCEPNQEACDAYAQVYQSYQNAVQAVTRLN